MKKEDGEDTGKRQKIDELLEYLQEKPSQGSLHIGIQKSALDPARPVKVSLTAAASAHVMQILLAARKLKNCEKFRNSFIVRSKRSLT